ncbi:MAG TPA: pyruvate dehydrogenase (acetyl-transferring) E1 component subunit alpha [Terriglobia bacterium]|nr:pyruvate dehydrogenase (acetyl-transferring) E1 component subunit alpha [Terriglobia bacterium]
MPATVPIEKDKDIDKSHLDGELRLLYLMLLIRRFEERASQAYQQQKIGGFCHLYIGQEAVVVGAVAAARPDDYMITAYRDHAHAIARGTTLNAAMAELLGKATGISKGLGGSMHYFDRENHMYGGHAIVGGHLPLATGMAFASRYRGEDRCTLCFFGDGAINQGVFHEACNLAALWKLPVIFICENNLFGMGTHVERATAVKELTNRAKAYDMPSMVMNGMDVREVRDSFRTVLDAMRKRPYPFLIEARTYRYRGHSMSDPATYRTKEELDKYKNEDPIIGFKSVLLAEAKLDEAHFAELDREAKQLAAESVRFAEESPEPPLEDLYKYTFAEGSNP